jgi:3-hydroxyacyl-CoA dehydrogenase
MWPPTFLKARRKAASLLCLDEVVKRGWIGDKAGQGFYKKSRGEDGKDLPHGARSQRPLSTGRR